MSKQERQSARAERQGEAARARKRARLQRRLTRITIITVIGAALAAWIFIPRRGSYTSGGSGAFIDGVLRYQNSPGHTVEPVVYPQTPPAGGPHNPSWLNCGIYSEAVPSTLAVHSMEHGAVWVTYHPELGADAIATLREHMPSTYVVMSPFAGLPTPIVLSAWNAQLAVNGPDDPRIPQFFEEYWRNQNVPEPGALCSGGIEGPGRS